MLMISPGEQRRVLYPDHAERCTCAARDQQALVKGPLEARTSWTLQTWSHESARMIR